MSRWNSFWVITGTLPDGRTETRQFNIEKCTKQQAEEVADEMVKRGLKNVKIIRLDEE
jgi:hypothetical protein